MTDSRDGAGRARATFEPDLVITDIQLPHVSGLELIGADPRRRGAARRADHGGHRLCGAGDEERIRAAGAQAYVSKPISVVRFVGDGRGTARAGKDASDGAAGGSARQLT